MRLIYNFKRWGVDTLRVGRGSRGVATSKSKASDCAIYLLYIFVHIYSSVLMVYQGMAAVNVVLVIQVLAVSCVRMTPCTELIATKVKLISLTLTARG